MSNLMAMYAGLTYRPLQASNYPALKYLHDRMFPIDYDEAFFQRAVGGDGIVSFVAVAREADLPARVPTSTTVYVNGEQLVGFITLKIFNVQDITSVDRQLLGLSGEHFNLHKLGYILTLGVAEVRAILLRSSMLHLYPTSVTRSASGGHAAVGIPTWWHCSRAVNPSRAARDSAKLSAAVLTCHLQSGGNKTCTDEMTLKTWACFTTYHITYVCAPHWPEHLYACYSCHSALTVLFTHFTGREGH